MILRTSITPSGATGTFAAHSIASSKSAHSSTFGL
jgi:hypothetical protein